MGARVSQDRRPQGPIRTCIATRTAQPAAQLLRVVARQAPQGIEVIPDPEHREPGRGAWITPTVEAYNQAVNQRAFQRALRTAVWSTKQVGDYLDQFAAQTAANASQPLMTTERFDH